MIRQTVKIAKLVWSIDGQPQKTVDLPDRDHANDGDAAEYNLAGVFPPRRARWSQP